MLSRGEFAFLAISLPAAPNLQIAVAKLNRVVHFPETKPRKPLPANALLAGELRQRFPEPDR